MAGFWTDNTVEPKRQFRFLLDLAPAGNLNTLYSYHVRTAKLPQFQMDGTAEVKYVQHTFKYPGRITWQPIDVTIIDPGTPDAAAVMMNIIHGSGYLSPKDPASSQVSISKKKSNDAMGGIFLRQISAEGVDIAEWTLHNPFLTNVDFGTQGYDSDDLVEYTLTIDYDYATYKSKGTPVADGT
tara:strand:+ start:673 stop:1221 length:549 start_codon:yes stop_codon:yes gene_type:complete